MMKSSMAPVDFPKHKIGLCMIVKNEARALARCLESVRSWVGEIVILDTGSTDETVSIANQYDTLIGHFKWSDDFAAARNKALDMSTREWVLVLDGDEFLTVDSPVEFAQALNQTNWDGFNIPIRSTNDDGSCSHAQLFRLFRRKFPGMRYRGAVHEQIEAVAERKVKTSSLRCIRLDHDGYTSAVVAQQDKVNRNIRLAHKLVESRSSDPFSWFVLATSIGQTDPQSMLEAANRSLDLLDASTDHGQDEQYVVNLYLSVIAVHLTRGDIHNVVKLVERGLAIFPDSPDLLYRRAAAQMTLGKFAAAAENFGAALAPSASAFSFVADTSTCGYGARTALAQALRQLGRPHEAVSQLRLAVLDAPARFYAAHAELGSLLLEQGFAEQAAPYLEEAHRRSPSATDVIQSLTWCYFKLRQFEKAHHLVRSLPRSAQTDLLLARIHLYGGNAEQVIPLLVDNELPAALNTLGWSHFVLGSSNQAENKWDAWMASQADDTDGKIALRAFRDLLTGDALTLRPTDISEPWFRSIDEWLLLLLRYRSDEHARLVLNNARTLGVDTWPLVRMRWAQLMVLNGHSHWSIELLMEAASQNPQDGAAFYWLGYCAMLGQQPDEARVLFEECLKCEPRHPQALQALGLL